MNLPTRGAGPLTLPRILEAVDGLRTHKRVDDRGASNRPEGLVIVIIVVLTGVGN